MAPSHFDQFLQEATCCEQESEKGLGGDSFYGLYTSWCCLSGKVPRPEQAFWAAMKHRLSPEQHLRMKGPAAADYILASYPAVV
ncbi:conserved hypothetical protein [Arthrobacter sp. 9AX]|uniref:hypothetical protein n=1 Tax=Arthrobacter sp. 9AX TaxID=2653131 RepID=UPI0012F02F42|nr:hypothetical protein [Arthrobacter sp. 9AX]VXC57060.1 conserved hypothetical protein [Arthrobacter sp. 9AX]